MNGLKSIPRISIIRKILVKTLPKAIVLFPPNEIDSVSHASKNSSFCKKIDGLTIVRNIDSSNSRGIRSFDPVRYIPLKYDTKYTDFTTYIK